MSRIVTVIQARVGSTRLPGKVLRPILGRPVLLRQIERIRRSQWHGTLVVATTSLPEDDTIVQLCESEHIHVLAGHPTDLLDRHWFVGSEYDAEAVVKIPSDCPLIDPKVIDAVIRRFLEGSFDYVSNLHPPSYPDGNDVEIMSMTALTQAHREARRPLEREHTTPFFWENPDRFRLSNVTWDTDLDYSMSHRWTLDYEEDFQFIQSVYEQLYSGKPAFDLEDILRLLHRRPDIAQMNIRYAGVNWYRHHLDELRTIDATDTRMEPALQGSR